MKKSTGLEKDLDRLFGKKPELRPEEFIQECFRLMREGKLLGILVSVYPLKEKGGACKHWLKWAEKPKGKKR